MNILLSYFLPFFLPSLTFHHFLSRQERNFWTINLCYTLTCFHFLTISCVIFIFCHGNLWKIFMPSGHAEYMLFYFHPVQKWRGYDPQSQSNIYGIAKTAYLGRSASDTLKMSTVGREKESTCSCLNCCSVLWSGFLHWFLSLRKEFNSLGCFQKIH